MFQVEIEGFSGPLDLLCHMVECREIEASKVKVSEVVALYGAYLARSGNLPIAVLADFIVQAAHLVLQKALALLPGFQQEQEVSEGENEFEEPSLENLLERYRPYRRAAALLQQLKEKADRRRFRKHEPMSPVYDLGDLYSLSTQWLELISAKAGACSDNEIEADDIEGVPPAIPDEVQVESRMARILEWLHAEHSGLSLEMILHQEPGRSSLVVTLLALLELSRCGQVKLIQKELFGDVFISARS